MLDSRSVRNGQSSFFSSLSLSEHQESLSTMFPRRTTITKYLGLLGIITMVMWMWTASPGNGPSDNSLLIGTRSMEGQNALRKNSPEKGAVTEAKKLVQTHHHSNLTLENMKKNMTLLKANQTVLQKLINKVNAEVNASALQNNSIFDDVIENPHPFKYIIFTDTVCKDKEIFMIAYVHTAPIHYKRRMVIRQTWGNPKHYPDTPIRVVFVMGKTNDEAKVQQALAFESEQYGDIIQEDFQDTYKNLTYKGVAALRWVSENCNHAKFVLKTDDDIFVNTFTLIRHLSSLSKHQIHDKRMILCLVWYKMLVMRTGKWKVSEEMFKDKYYPTYCSGSAYTMSMDAAIDMYKVSYHVPFFWVDDFYITGLLPLKLGIKHKQFMSTYVLDGRKLEDKFTGPQWFTYIFSHVHNLNKIQSVWTRLVKLATLAEKPQIQFALPGNLPNEAEIRKKEAEEEKKKEEERKKKAEEKKKKEEADKKKAEQAKKKT